MNSVVTASALMNVKMGFFEEIMLRLGLIRVRGLGGGWDLNLTLPACMDGWDSVTPGHFLFKPACQTN